METRNFVIGIKNDELVHFCEHTETNEAIKDYQRIRSTGEVDKAMVLDAEELGRLLVLGIENDN